MKIVTITCDICGKDMTKEQTGANFAGMTTKMDSSAQLLNVAFDGYYCGDDLIKIIEYISKLKEENANNNNTRSMDEQTDTARADTRP